VFVLFLVMIAVAAVISLSIKGASYYFTPLDQRPFRPDYESMKPSGSYSHSLGIFGSLMIVLGVSTYSTRKRMRKLWHLGRLSRWLEFHIVLCLIGPILVAYHTTFKAGGIAAVSLWTMLSVAASGIIGRFLYVQIPRNIQGNALTLEEIAVEMERRTGILETNEFGISLRTLIDQYFSKIPAPKSLLHAFGTFFQLERTKHQVKRLIHESSKHLSMPHGAVSSIKEAALARATLLQRSMVLSQFERLFFYWHAIHLPFSIIMFITLAAHVTVVLLLGYTWIF